MDRPKAMQNSSTSMLVSSGSAAPRSRPSWTAANRSPSTPWTASRSTTPPKTATPPPTRGDARATHDDRCAPSPLRPLPIQVRPRQAETVNSYVRRLARANHLRPSYLRAFLCGPPQYYGAIRPERLAALAGRPVWALEHALTDLAPPPRSQPRTPTRQQRPATDKPELFAAIRRDFTAHGLSIRTLADRYRVHRRTVRQALTTPDPPPRKPLPPRHAPALEPVRDLIDAMLAAKPDLAPWRIWERLLDEHDADISYSTVRGHIVRRRLESVAP